IAPSQQHLTHKAARTKPRVAKKRPNLILAVEPINEKLRAITIPRAQSLGENRLTKPSKRMNALARA
ncbi:MAG: hypothetical protein LUB83_04875, partial [Prevotellaceae bacterium]|nr:hypothetical protein [Prevotellaceae bacterium]